ncbi:MAG: NUDIX domain-containing protein [Clostridia bacterium]|nr:NUDIX domain-containing protein [Clostridia bacterium]
MISPYHDETTVTPDLRPMTAIYLTRGDQLLLLYRKGSRVVGNSYTGAAGGHMEPEEFNSARACVLRELEEETGLTESALEGLSMRYVTMRLKNGEIRENYYFFAALRAGCEPKGSNEGDLTWCPLAELESLPMPVTAAHVLRHYVDKGRFDQLLYGGVTTPAGTVFTPMTEF